MLNSDWALFREHGFTKTSMRMIAQAAGVSLGLVTYHFVVKETCPWRFWSFSVIISV